jgi:tryptophanyl-tRNA synthetase
VGDVEVKRRLAQVLNSALEPIRQRRTALAARPQDALDILRTGTSRARTVVQATLHEVMTRMGLGAGRSMQVSVIPPVKPGTFC